LPYPDLNDRRARLSMSFAGHYRIGEIEPRHVAAEAVEVGLDPEWALDRAREIAGGVTDAYSQAVRESHLVGEAVEFGARIVDASRAHSDRLKGQLERARGAKTRTQAATSSVSQPRNKDVRGDGNPGAFASPR